MKHNIDLLRVEAGERKRIVSFLSSLEDKILNRIENAGLFGDTIRVKTRQKRLTNLFEVVESDISNAYKKINEINDAFNAELIEVESEAVARAINAQIKADLISPISTVTKESFKSAVTVELASGRLSAEVLRGIASNMLIDGAPSGEWWAGQADNLRKAFLRNMREGYINNETIQQLTRRVRGTRAAGYTDGIMQIARKNAELLVRSSVMTVANESRMETYRQNQDVIKGVQWSSTLDSRTTKICVSLSGDVWLFRNGALVKAEGTQHEWRGPPPAHFACRSAIIPVTRSWSELIKDPVLRDKLEALEGSRKRSVRNSLDGKSAKEIKYADWLLNKDKNEIKSGIIAEERTAYKVLGKERYKLWASDFDSRAYRKDNSLNKLPLSKLIDQSHNPMTLDELRAKLRR